MYFMIEFFTDLWSSFLYAVFLVADYLFQIIIYAALLIFIVLIIFTIIIIFKKSFPFINKLFQNLIAETKKKFPRKYYINISKNKDEFGLYPAYIELLKNKKSICQLRQIKIPFEPNKSLGEYLFDDCGFSDSMPFDINLYNRKEKSKNYYLSDMLFFDTETTGLSGSGVYVFLCSFGYFKSNVFVIEQFFMEDFSDESFMLEHVREKLKTFPILVSFNGKSFDLKRLSDRFIMNRIRINFDMPHIDLFYPSRRIWKKHLPNCKLSTIEQKILKIYRKSDVSGEDIPQIYFDYIDGNRDELIYRVFNHNAQDILSLPILLIRINSIYNRE